MARQKKPLDLTGIKVPVHVAIIMDGNGRWATAKGLARAEGHCEGAKAADLNSRRRAAEKDMEAIRERYELEYGAEVFALRLQPDAAEAIDLVRSGASVAVATGIGRGLPGLEETANQITHALAGWWFDMEGGWFDAPEAMDVIERLTSVAERLGARPW